MTRNCWIRGGCGVWLLGLLNLFILAGCDQELGVLYLDTRVTADASASLNPEKLRQTCRKAMVEVLRETQDPENTKRQVIITIAENPDQIHGDMVQAGNEVLDRVMETTGAVAAVYPEVTQSISGYPYYDVKIHIYVKKLGGAYHHWRNKRFGEDTVTDIEFWRIEFREALTKLRELQ